MRISDWSSDVCSSDLIGAAPPEPVEQHRRREDQRGRIGDALPRDVGRRAVLCLRDADIVAGVDRTAEAEAAAEFRCLVGQYVAEHVGRDHDVEAARSEEHTSELQSLMRNSYAVFCLKK